MSEGLAETIEKGKETLEVASRPSVFPVLVAVLALAGVGFLVWRDEMRADAQIAVLQSMTAKIGELSQHIQDTDSDLRLAGVAIGTTKHMRAVQAVDKE